MNLFENPISGLQKARNIEASPPAAQAQKGGYDPPMRCDIEASPPHHFEGAPLRAISRFDCVVGNILAFVYTLSPQAHRKALELATCINSAHPLPARHDLWRDPMDQPAYDLEFGEMIRWLKQHKLILQSDLEGNAELSTHAERIGRKRRREAGNSTEPRHKEHRSN